MSALTPGRLVVISGAIYGPDPHHTDSLSVTFRPRICLMDRETAATSPTERDANATHLVNCWNAFEPGAKVDTLTQALNSALTTSELTRDALDCVHGPYDSSDLVKGLKELEALIHTALDQSSVDRDSMPTEEPTP